MYQRGTIISLWIVSRPSPCRQLDTIVSVIIVSSRAKYKFPMCCVENHGFVHARTSFLEFVLHMCCFNI